MCCYQVTEEKSSDVMGPKVSVPNLVLAEHKIACRSRQDNKFYQDSKTEASAQKWSLYYCWQRNGMTCWDFEIPNPLEG